MLYSQEQIKESNEIIALLLTGEPISSTKHKEYHSLLNMDFTLKELVEFTLANFGMRLIKNNKDSGSFFITPGINNRIFGWKNEDIKKTLSLKTNKDMYVCYFIMYIIFISFFKETGNVVAKDFILASDIVDKVTTVLQSIELKSISDDKNMNESFQIIKETWENKKVIDTEQTTESITKGILGSSQYHFVNKALFFMVKEDLLIKNEMELSYSTTERFKAIVSDFYNEKEIKNELLELMECDWED